MAAANMLPNNSMNFTENQHGHAILETLRLQREQRRFCDVILHVQGQQFEAHRNVLASCSKYFQSMFKQEKTVKEQLTISCGGHEIFRCLLDYIYTGNVVIDKHNVSELVRLSNHFHVLKLRAHCSEYLERYLDVANCLSVRELADRYQMRELLRTTISYIRANIDEVLQQQEAMQLPHNKVEQLIMDKELLLSPERQLTFTLDWVQHATSARENELRQLLVSTPLQLVDRSRLLQLLQSHRLLAENERCLYFTLQSLADAGVRLPAYEQLLSQMEDKYMQDQLVVDNDTFLSMAISTAIEEMEVTEATIFDGLHRLQQQAAGSSSQVLPIETFSISAIDETDLASSDLASGEQETARDLRCHPTSSSGEPRYPPAPPAAARHPPELMTSPVGQRYTEYGEINNTEQLQNVDKYTCEDQARYSVALAEHTRATQRQNSRYRSVNDGHEMAGVYPAGGMLSGSGCGSTDLMSLPGNRAGDITYMMMVKQRGEKTLDDSECVSGEAGVDCRLMVEGPSQMALPSTQLQYVAYSEYTSQPGPLMYSDQPAALAQCRFETRRHAEPAAEDALALDTRSSGGGYSQSEQMELRAASYVGPEQIDARASGYVQAGEMEDRGVRHARDSAYIQGEQIDIRGGAVYPVSDQLEPRGGANCGYIAPDIIDARGVASYACDQLDPRVAAGYAPTQLDSRGFPPTSSPDPVRQTCTDPQQRLRLCGGYDSVSDDMARLRDPPACYLTVDGRVQYDSGGYGLCDTSAPLEPLPCSEPQPEIGGYQVSGVDAQRREMTRPGDGAMFEEPARPVFCVENSRVNPQDSAREDSSTAGDNGSAALVSGGTVTSVTPPPNPPPPPPMPAKKRKLDPGLAEELRSSEIAPQCVPNSEVVAPLSEAQTICSEVDSVVAPSEVLLVTNEYLISSSGQTIHSGLVEYTSLQAAEDKRLVECDSASDAERARCETTTFHGPERSQDDSPIATGKLAGEHNPDMLPVEPAISSEAASSLQPSDAGPVLNSSTPGDGVGQADGTSHSQRTVNMSPKKKRLRLLPDDVAASSSEERPVGVNKRQSHSEPRRYTLETVDLAPLLAVPADALSSAAAAVPSSTADTEGETLYIAADRPGKHACRRCPAAFNNRHALDKHNRDAHGGVSQQAAKTFVCNICSATSSRRSLHYQHMHTHFEGPPFTCNICYNEFRTLAKFLVHRREHGENKPHRCPECNFSFWKKFNLTNHMRIHRGDRPFTCTVCEATFALATTLKQHMTKHTKRRHLTCDQCDFSTKYTNHLAQHKKLHAGDVHRCSHAGCSYTTPKRSHLREHLQAHAKRRTHQCPHCTRSFNTNTHLARHLRSHDRSKLVRCHVCQYETHRTDRLKQHVASHFSKSAGKGKGRAKNKVVENGEEEAAAPATEPTLAADWPVF